MAVFPKATFSFSLPSLHDGSELECRLYLPNLYSSSDSTKCQNGAVVAHPYAPLGGCYDDPVVNIVASELLDQGLIVMTFNFRGAGRSQGRTSWTGKPEIQDYATIAGFLVQYMCLLRQTETIETTEPLKLSSINVIFAGYSYGSQIASRLPELQDILTPLVANTLTRSANAVRETAIDLVRRSEQHLYLSKPPRRSIVPSVPPGITDLSWRFIEVAYLLVSPLLPPISTLVALPFGNGPSSEESLRKFKERPTMAIYGDDDTFTSVNKLQQWASGLNKVNSTFSHVQCEGAGHFWRESNAVKCLKESVATFTRGVIHTKKVEKQAGVI